MISWRCRPQVRGWGTLDDGSCWFHYLGVQLYIPYGIRMHKGFRHCPHVTYASFKMNIIVGYFAISYDWVQWLTDNRPNSFNICKWVCQTVTQFTRLLSFPSVFSTSLSLFPPDSMGMSLSSGGFLSHRGFRHTKSPGETATAEDRRRGLPKLVAIRPAPRRNGGGPSAARNRGGAVVVLRRLLLVLSERGSVTNKNGIRN
jgi:hypothetical protein